MDAEERAQRPAPYVDRRVYTSWNAALAISYFDAALRLDRPALRERAARLLERLFHDAYEPGKGMTHAEGVGGQLADQAWSLWAALRAHQAGLGDRWMPVALGLAAHIEGAYGDPPPGGLFAPPRTNTLGTLPHPFPPLHANPYP